MPSVPLAVRIVEVIADLGEGRSPRYRFGSGCLVSGRTVLTSAHVVVGAVSILVRGQDKVAREALADPAFTGDADGPGPDLALIEVVDGIAVPAMGLAAVVRDSPTGDPVERCHAIGYPAFMERETPDHGRFRETADALGQVPALSGLAGGLLSVQVSSAPQPLPPAHQVLRDSPWSGMSGAPVVADGLLLGVVTEHASRAGPSAITATPLTALEADPAHPRSGPGVPDHEAWWTRLGVSGAEALRRLPTVRARARSAYWATVQEIRQRTQMLTGRHDELAAIAAFATGDESYRWLVGEAWAGKTSLLVEAVASGSSEQVDVVAYFLSQRETDADANRFLVAVVPQLAELLDEDEPQHLDVHQFRALWVRAAAAAAAAGRHLLLVVDGLDEDLRPSGSPSVAAWLPAAVPAHAHVLVSSRLHPELPADVSATHPLRTVQPELLKPFAGGIELGRLASQELAELKRRDPDDLALTVLGVLTAAAGPLAVDDLAALTGAPSAVPTPGHTARVRRLVTEDAGRSLQPIASGPKERYQFAHASLLQEAQADDDLAHPDYRARIHQWADTWRNAGWPTAVGGGSPSTPAYLLGEYLTTLTRDPARQQAIAGDIRWSAAAIQSLGVDRVIADIKPAAQAAGVGSPSGTVHAILRARAHDLRDRQAARDRRFVARQLCFHLLEYGEQALADTLRDQLLTLPDPGPTPLWSTRRSGRAMQFELPPIPGGAEMVEVLPDGRIFIVAGGDLSAEQQQLLLADPARPGAEIRQLGRLEHGRVSGTGIMPDGRIVMGVNVVFGPSDDEAEYEARLVSWNPADDAALAELGRIAGEWVDTVAVLPDGNVVTSSHAARRGGGGKVFNQVFFDQGGEQGHLLSNVLIEPAGATGETSAAEATAAQGEDAGVTRLRLWDPAQPEASAVELGSIAGTDAAMALTPAGRVIGITGTTFSETDGWLLRLVEWDPARPGAEPTVLARFRGNWPSYFAVLPDGRIVLNHVDMPVIWDRARPDVPVIELARVFDAKVRVGAVLPDGRMILGVGEGNVVVWSPTSSDAIRIALGRITGSSLAAAALLPDGRIITSSNAGGWAVDGRIQVWDPALGGNTPEEPSQPVSGQITAIAVLPDGRIAYSTSDGHDMLGDGESCVLIWDPGRPDMMPTELGRFEGGVINAIAVLPDRRIITAAGCRQGDGGLIGSADGRVHVWDPAHPGATPIELGRVDSGRVMTVAVLPDGRVVTGSGPSPGGCDYGQLLVWDPARPGRTPAELYRLDGGWISAVAVLDDERIVVTTGNNRGEEGRVLVFDPASPDVDPLELGRRLRWLRGIVVLPDGRIVTGSDGSPGEDAQLLIWDMDRPGERPLQLGIGIGRPLSGIQALPGGQIATIAVGRLAVWDPSALVMTHSLPCDADALAVTAGGDGHADLIVVHRHGRGVSGWLVPQPRGSHPDDPETLSSHIELGAAYVYAGRMTEAILLLQRTLADCERLLGADHDLTLDSRHNLASAYLEAGRAADAVPLLEQTLASRERLQGADHSATLISRGSLASAYLNAGRLAESVLMNEQALADFERVLGADHPYALTSRNNLASAYIRAGRVTEAISLLEQAVADQERILGAHHPDTLVTRVNLASAYEDTGRAADAIRLYELSLADVERVLGADYPKAVTARGRLVSAYLDAGQVAEAIPILERIVAEFEREPTADDSVDYLICRGNLGNAYLVAGRAAEAIPLLELTVADCERLLGADHPNTGIYRHNLASALQDVGRGGDAIPLLEQMLADSERLQGADSSATLVARGNLASAYVGAGRLTEAIPLYEQTLADCERLLGADHPDALTSRHNLASAYLRAGRATEAIPLLKETLAGRERLLGGDDPRTALDRRDLASAYVDGDRVAEAIAQYEQALADFERLLGADHGYTLTTRDDLARAYRSAGRVAEASALYEQALADFERLLGADHPRTLVTRANHAFSYLDAGRVAEAIALLERTAADFERVQGADHRNTQALRERLAAARDLTRLSGGGTGLHPGEDGVQGGP